MPDYSKGKIYTIRCRNDPSLIYVGSTIQSLAKRFGEHKKSSNNEKKNNYRLYKEVNGDWTDWYIELSLTFPCNSVEELRKKEGEVIREIGTLNKTIAGRTLKEYHNDNLEKITEYKKKYREENRTKIQEKDKQHYKDNLEKIKEYRKQSFTCSCGGHFTILNKIRHERSKKHQNYLSREKCSSITCGKQ